MKESSFEEKVNLQLSQIELAIRSVSSAISTPYMFPKQEISNYDEEFAKQREENRKDIQIGLLQKQNKILINTLIVTGASVIVSAVIQVVNLFMKK